MSRDWTPRELYSFEKWNIANGHGSLFDIMKDTNWIIRGKKVPLYSEEMLSNRQKYPLLGRLYDSYDDLYSAASKVNGGLKVLDRLELELYSYIHTGQGDKDSVLIQWFEGQLDPAFHYRERNDALFFQAVKQELDTLQHSDPHHGRCVWFALSADKCVSVWYDADRYDGDQLLMKLERRASDGSMGPHCQVLIDESYGTGDLKASSIETCLQEVYQDARLEKVGEKACQKLANDIMVSFKLKKPSLEYRISSADAKAGKRVPLHDSSFEH